MVSGRHSPYTRPSLLQKSAYDIDDIILDFSIFMQPVETMLGRTESRAMALFSLFKAPPPSFLTSGMQLIIGNLRNIETI